MTEAKHTPTPWRVDTNRADGVMSMIESQTDFVAFCECASYGGNDAANAAFIVEACNAHGPLMDALGALDQIDREIMAAVKEGKQVDHMEDALGEATAMLLKVYRTIKATT